MTLQELEQLKERILSERCMDRKNNAPRIMVGMGTCGIKAGAMPVLAQLRSELAGAANVVVTHVGCKGLCSCEPLVEVVMPGERPVTYFNMTPEKAVRVAREHIIGGKPIPEWTLAK